MKIPVSLFLLAAVGSFCFGQAPSTAKPNAAPEKLSSNLYDWQKMTLEPNARGARRMVFDGPTATTDKMHCHITTLNPGEKSGEPTKRLEEEVIIVKEGTVEANWDGQSKTGGPGSVIFFTTGSTTFLRNAGSTPCTYVLIYYYTPLTPKS